MWDGVCCSHRNEANRVGRQPGTMKGNVMFTVSIELPESVKVAVGDTGAETLVDIKAIAAAHPQVLRFAVLNGFIGALNNVSRGKNDDSAANSDAVWASLRDKRAAVWMQGDWAGKGGGGERQSAALRDAYVAERLAAGMTSAQVDKSIKDAVKATFGDKEPATFSRFMDAVATGIGKRDGLDEAGVADVRQRIEAKYRKLADDAAKARAKASAAVDVLAIEF
jgi:hypothetical protein